MEAAIAEGFEVIGFSDHSPYLFEHGYVSGIRMDMCELEGYVRTVEELKRTNHMAILLVSHDLDVVRRYADRVALMQGTIVRQGDPETVFDSEEVAQVSYTRGGHV